MKGHYGTRSDTAGRGDHAAFIGCGTKSSGGSRVRKDFIKSIYKSD